MKYILILILLGISLSCHAVIVNTIVADIGQYSISKYDIHRMEEFLQANKSTNNAFTELLMAYSIFTAVESDPDIIYRSNEIVNFITALTNSTNTTDSSLKMRQQLFHDYPDEYIIEIKKTQMLRTLSYYKTNIKNSADEPIPEGEIKDFYNKNKKIFTEPPKLDLIIVSVPQPPQADLDMLDRIENILTAITNSLSKSDDIDAIMNKYKNSLYFEPYSGRTGLKDVFELYRNGCPDELLNLSLLNSIPMRSAPPMIVTNGLVIGYEKIIFKNSPNKMHYFIVKILKKKLEQQSSYEQSKAAIENILKENKLLYLIENYVKDKINKGEISVNIVDKSYEGVYDELLRR